jgi:hypothetical protein
MKETPPQKRHVVRRWSLVTEHGRAMIALMAWLTHFARKVSHGTPLRSDSCLSMLDSVEGTWETW